MSRPIYFDYAAATPMDARVREAMEPYFADQFYNPSATYLSGRAVKKDLEAARAEVAQCLGGRAPEIIFTAGTTEANNLAIQGVMRQFPDSEVLISSIEHESIIAPASEFKHKPVGVTGKGILDLDDLKKQISSKTVLISIMMVNNELGTLQPLKEVVEIVREVKRTRNEKGDKTPLYLHTDAAQAGNCFDLHVSRLGIDLMSISGGKIYGPKQSGALFVRTGVELKPLILGGGQERGIRSGTENVAGVIGFAAALRIAQKGRSGENVRLHKLRDQFTNDLELNIPKAVVNGSSKRQSPHLVSVTFPGKDNERLMMELDELGMQCALGSACSASNDEPSHILTAIGLSRDKAQSTLRFSFGRGTSEADIRRLSESLRRLS